MFATHGGARHPRRVPRQAVQSQGVVDLTLSCDECAHKTTIPDIAIDGMTPGEMNDAAQAHLVARGWSVRRSVTGGREFICPTCTKRVSDAEINTPLPPLDVEGPCPKCGEPKPEIRYFSGREVDNPLRQPREHMGLTCRRCRYVWVQGCLDQGTPDNAGHPADRPGRADGGDNARDLRPGGGEEDRRPGGGDRAAAD